MAGLIDIIDGLAHTKSETEEHIGPLHASNIQDAIDALKAMQWVPIADIPEEWKDENGLNEGYVDIVNAAGCRFPDAKLIKNYEIIGGRYTGGASFYWESSSGHEIDNPAYARLPPQPPQDRKEG